MKIKIFLIVFLLFINLQGKVLAYDCNFEKIKPGVTKKELEKINIFAYGPAVSDIFTKHLFVEKACNGDTEGLSNINMVLVFYKDSNIGEYDLLASESIKKLNIFSRLIKSINYLIWGDV